MIKPFFWSGGAQTYNDIPVLTCTDQGVARIEVREANTSYFPDFNSG